MLSVFPSFLTWGLAGPLIIRITLGIIFIHWSYKVLLKSQPNTKQKVISLLEAVAGILLVIGLFTQVAALFITLDLIVRLYFKVRARALFTDGVNYYFVLLVLALSLLVSGSGFLAFDLPL